MKKTSSSSNFRKRVDYISTVLAYCWLILISKVRHAVQSGVLYIIRWFMFVFLPQRYLDKFDEHHMNALEEQEILFGNLECGHDIRLTKQLVYNTFGGYMTLPFVVVASIVCSLIGWDFVFLWEGGAIPIAIILIWAVLVFIGLRIFTNALDEPQVYIPYFKKFESQNAEWLRKWKRYTILLFVGNILSVALSFGFILLCIDIHRNFQG